MNNGAGVFGVPIYFAGPPLASLSIGDFNGDGRLDVAGAVGGLQPSQVLVYLNTCDQPPADLALTLDGPAAVAEGETFPYVIQITNHGPNDATGVHLEHLFGTNSEFVSIGGSPGSCSVVRNRVSCELGTLANGATLSYTVVVRALSGGAPVAAAGVTATTSDPDPSNNSAIVQTTVTPGASTLVVTNTNDSGPGSFRQALINANGDAGPRDTIVFNIPGTGVHTIRPSKLPDLPTITQSVVIDGTTQPGYAGTPLIELDGSGADVVNGLVVGGPGNSVIRGLAINRFPLSGLLLQSPANVIESNFIGTNAAGTAALPNGGDGITIRGAGNTIGGATAGAGNLISGNLSDGLDLGAGATNNLIQGNRIGTNATGTAALGNAFQGIWIAGGATGNTIGGGTPGAGNLLSGNGTNGVSISGTTTTSNTVLGNFIGTNAAGTAPIGNVFDGVGLLSGTAANLIGDTPAGRNLISGNRNGIFISAGSAANTIRTNFIGTDVTGTAPVPNLVGGIFVNASGNFIGAIPGSGNTGNTIAFNTGAGILVNSGTSIGIQGNAIFSNDALGIDLGPPGVTPNDANDTDTGANNLQNFPVLTAATVSAGTLTVTGTLNSTPNATFAVQFFGNAACDASGNGEGALVLPAIQVTTNGSGVAAINTSFGAAVTAGQVITATATSATNDTSEFSACRVVTATTVASADVSITKHDSTDPVVVNTPFTYTLTVHNAGPDPATGVVAIDTLPVGLTASSAVSNLGTCTIDAPVVTCTVGSLAVNQDATITISVTATTTGLVVNQASVTAAQPDPTPANNSATETTVISEIAPCTAATFTGPLPFDNTPGRVPFVRLVDMNHDGELDVVASNQLDNDGGISVMLNNTVDGFLAPSFTSIGQQALGFAVADFNGDTHRDVMVASATGSGNLRLLLGDGAGHLTLSPLTIPISSGSAVEAFDQDGDGDQDVIVRGTSNELMLLRNDGAGNFAPPVPLLANIANTFVVGDFNEDSRADIAVALPTSGVSVLLANTGGGYGAPVNIPTTGPNIRLRVTGDFNEDGHLDLVITEGLSASGTAHVSTLAGNGNGGFAPPLDVGAGGFANATATADVNGDGHLDLITNYTVQGVVGVQLGTGTGTFATSTFITAEIFSNPAVGDVTGQGRPDIIFGNSEGRILALLNTCGQPPADLAVSIAESADPINEGDEITYTVTLRNLSGTPATNVQLTSLQSEVGGTPVQSELIDTTSSRPGTLSQVDETTVWTLPSVPANSITTFTFRVRTFGGGILSVTSGATSANADPDGSNNTAFESTTVNSLGRTLVVTNTNDDGAGSLREAIQISNADTNDLDRITFNIPGPGPHTIIPLTPLPFITAPTVIDGTSEPDFAGTPIIELNGNGLAGAGLTITGGGSTVRGLVINRFGGMGIQLQGGNSLIAGNYIGVDVTGQAARPNGGNGVQILSGGNAVGGGTAADRNIISGNTGTGVAIFNGSTPGNRIQGNYIGTNVTGNAAVPNLLLQSGILINAGSANLIGGSTPGQGNVVSGNATHAITIIGATANGNIIQGNFIGTTASGNARLANGGIGVDIVSAINTVVGGPAFGRNVISGNGTGIQIRTGATGNIVQNNYIGLNANGNAAISNNLGVNINDNANNNTIGGTATLGNMIGGNTGPGISISLTANGNVITGNQIGTNVIGDAAVGNTGNGISINNSANTQIGGTTPSLVNLISGNGGSGISVTNAAGTRIEGNRIGTNALGTAAIANANNGITISAGATNTTVGGTASGAGNVISGNPAAGIAVNNPGTSGTTILGNYLGTNAAGTAGIGNGHGVNIVGGASNTTVGGTAAGARNVLSGNSAYGVRIADAGTSGNRVLGNYVGTNATGTAAIPNGLSGVFIISGASGNTIGGTQPAEGNVISGNASFGVAFFGVATDAGGNTVLNNFIGTDAAGTGAIGNNASGVFVETSNNRIGSAGVGNTIAFNGDVGVRVGGGTGNTIANNRIFSNASLGIDLGNSGVTQNDAGDGDTGPNNLQNFPVLAAVSGGVQGTLNSTASTTFRIEFFGNTACDASGNGEGQTVLGNTTVTTDGAGNASVPLFTTAPGAIVTATATDPAGNTSEFSACATVPAGPATFVVTNTNDSGPGSLRQAILDANVNFIPDTIRFAIEGPGRTISPTSQLPTITNTVAIDGTTQPGFAGTPIIELSGAGAPAGSNGLVISAADTLIQGLIINRWSGSGIVLQGPNADSVVGNWIGTASNGTSPAGNGNGILILSSQHLIGGSTAAERNVISGNTVGVNIGSTSARGNGVIGNYIGTDRTGTLDVGNTNAGVRVIGEINFIGGTTPGTGNVISGNDQAGVALEGFATSNSVEGNAIGTNAARTAAIPNGIGVALGLVDNASSNTIGGPLAGQGNLIAFNTGAGVVVAGSSTNNVISQNSIRDNGALGIDLGADGLTPNDAGDADEGGNDRVNFPVLTGVGGGVQGTFNSIPDTTFRIEFFGNVACDASGNGEGATFLGATTVGTDGAGNATIPLFSAAAGQVVTATATDPSGNTSEFSACVQPLGASAEIALTATDSPDPVVVGTQLGYLVTVTNNGPSPATNARISVMWNGTVNLDAATPSQGTCEAAPIFNCTFGTIPSGATVTTGIAVRPTVIGPLTATVTAQADEPDPVPANNAVAVNTTVIGGPFSFLVVNTNDSGAGSLRQAILNANASAGADVIQFAIPGTGVQTITLASALPTVTDSATIDGATQPGFVGAPLIELNGNGLVGNGLTVSAANTTIRGLVINRFVGGFAGIAITGSSATNTVVQGNYIGTNAAGTAPLPNSSGITIRSLASGALIGGTAPGAGNLISGNGTGISVQVSTQNSTILGNIIGLNQSGTTALANSVYGIQVSAGDVTIGGTQAGARNIISGNGLDGVALTGNQSTFNSILGNYIGTNIDGTTAVPNGQSGIVIGQQAQNNRVGGVGVGAGNVISGNLHRGIYITDAGPAGNVVQGNVIGTNAAGTTSLPNAIAGIVIFGISNNQIGGAAAGAGNLVSGNGGAGIVLSGSATNLIQGNRIGTNAAGTSGVPNAADGVLINGSSNNQIGGAAGNTIRFNFGAGVNVSTALSTNGNLISGNAISDNIQLGIDLGILGVTPNDSGDADTGANNLQNFPVLTAASGGVQGTLNSTPNTTFRIEFFGNGACDASGNGEGATFLGATTAATDGAGNGTIPLFTAAAGQFVTATATDSSNNTSEFSTCVLTAVQPEITIAATDPDAAELGGNTATVVVTRTGPTTADRDVVVNLTGTAAQNGTDYTISSPALDRSGESVVLHAPHPAGQTTATVTVTPLFTPEVEGPETVILTAEGSSATVTIADEPAVTLTATDPNAAELGANTGTVVVTRNGPNTYDRDVVVTLTGTADQNGTDYTISSPSVIGLVNPSFFTLRIPAGQTTATVTVTPLFTPEVEGPETVILTAEGSSATVTIADEPAVTLTADGSERRRARRQHRHGRRHAHRADDLRPRCRGHADGHGGPERDGLHHQQPVRDRSGEPVVLHAPHPGGPDDGHRHGHAALHAGSRGTRDGDPDGGRQLGHRHDR